MNKKLVKAFILLVIVAAIILFFIFDVHKYLTLENLRVQKSALDNFYSNNTSLTIFAYFVMYVIVTALSLPGAAIMTLAGGAVFGFITGTIIVSFASTIGATLAFLVARFFLRSYVQGKFGDKLKVINEGIEREGAFYLFSLRLIPVFPFFMINLLVALTPMSTKTFYLVSQVGMFLGTMAFVNAGTQLSKIESLSGILSPGIILSFVVIGLLPLIFKKLVPILRKYYGKKAKEI